MVAIALVSIPAIAQNAPAQRPQGGKQPGHETGKQRQERLQAERIAHITAELDLSAEEAQAFWPVYNKASKEQKEANKAVRQKFVAMKKAIEEGASDADINSLTEEYLKARSSKKDVMASYHKEFLKVLPAVKVAKLYVAEESFRNKQLHRLGGGKKSNGPRPNGPRPEK